MRCQKSFDLQPVLMMFLALTWKKCLICFDLQKDLLQVAIEENDIEALKVLHRKGADINVKINNQTLLHIALEMKRTEIAKALIQRGASINAMTHVYLINTRCLQIKTISPCFCFLEFYKKHLCI